MTDQDQQIALCEWVGWTRIHKDAFTKHGLEPMWTNPACTAEDPFKRLRESVYERGLPDTSPLDVLHEMEKKLTREQANVYNRWLVAKLDFTDLQLNYFAWHATAAQRREALLKAIGKWKD
jgi:hypothetical protein